MRRVLFAVLGVGLLVGGCTSGAVFDRLAANDTLRAACPWLPDANINTMLMGTDYDREVGYSKTDETEIVMNVCASTVDPAACMVCSLAVLDQVYGE